MFQLPDSLLVAQNMQIVVRYIVGRNERLKAKR